MMWKQLEHLASTNQPFIWGVGAFLGLGFTAVTSYALGRKVGRAEGAELSGGFRGGAGETLFAVKKDKRIACRRTGTVVEVEYALESEPHTKMNGLVVDRSLGGLRIVVDAPLETGVKLVILPANAPKGTQWVEAEVRSCNQQDEHWEIGCKFLSMPSYATMVLFG